MSGPPAGIPWQGCCCVDEHGQVVDVVAVIEEYGRPYLDQHTPINTAVGNERPWAAARGCWAQPDQDVTGKRHGTDSATSSVSLATSSRDTKSWIGWPLKGSKNTEAQNLNASQDTSSAHQPSPSLSAASAQPRPSLFAAVRNGDVQLRPEVLDIAARAQGHASAASTTASATTLHAPAVHPSHAGSAHAPSASAASAASLQAYAMDSMAVHNPVASAMHAGATVGSAPFHDRGGMRGPRGLGSHRPMTPSKGDDSSAFSLMVESGALSHAEPLPAPDSPQPKPAATRFAARPASLDIEAAEPDEPASPSSPTSPKHVHFDAAGPHVRLLPPPRQAQAANMLAWGPGWGQQGANRRGQEYTAQASSAAGQDSGLLSWFSSALQTGTEEPRSIFPKSAPIKGILVTTPRKDGSTAGYQPAGAVADGDRLYAPDVQAQHSSTKKFQTEAELMASENFQLEKDRSHLLAERSQLLADMGLASQTPLQSPVRAAPAAASPTQSPAQPGNGFAAHASCLSVTHVVCRCRNR
eukprot:gb/GFBE01001633.1/.p1 GENE.gb/GFBE01001633.1/~~gb/GFBE01001633.1/.p1  ORF type:complete len:526 (+),score=56.50 gb/GFBE01001633.1/:1-1578(+)